MTPNALHSPLSHDHAGRAGFSRSWQQALACRLPGLPIAALTALAPLAKRRTFPRQGQVLAAGDRWSDLIWVESGLLRLFYIDLEGSESNKNFHAEDAMLWPVTPSLRHTPVAFFVAALEPTVLWQLPMDALEQQVAALPSWLSMQHQALSALFDDKLRRERLFLQSSARERYEDLLAEHPAWAQRIALRQLASYLGMTDVSLSRVRAGMGLITR